MGFSSTDIRVAKHGRISLSLQPLEPRLMLSGDSWLDVASLVVSPAWLESVDGFESSNSEMLSDYGTRTVELRERTIEVMQDHWIVHFTADAVDGIGVVADTAGLLTSDVDFEVLRGLGMVGMVLIRTDAADPDAVESWLSANENVANYGYNTITRVDSTYSNDPYLGSALWAMNNTGQTGGTPDADVDAVQAWDITTGSADIVVGVIDSGVDYTHPDLYLNTWINQGEIPGPIFALLSDVDTDGLFTFYDLNDAANAAYVSDLNSNGYIDGGDLLADPAWADSADTDGNTYTDDLLGYDFYDGDADPMDDYGHGTHVAGTIGAVGDNAEGVVGVNWTTSIMALRVGSGGGLPMAAIIEAINYTTWMKTEFDNGDFDGMPGADVRVTNNSYGGGNPDVAREAAIAAYGAAGGVFVAAAGNSSSNNDLFATYPCGYDLDNIISVAATDHNDRLASFSNYGTETVDIAAPGVSIYSTYLGGVYTFMQGTSMAAPMVTGVAALAWAANPSATMEQVRGAVLAGAEPMDSLSGLVATSGRLNAAATLERVMLADPVHVPVAAFVSGPVAVSLYDAQGYINIDPLAIDVRFSGGSGVKEVRFGGESWQDGMGVVISGASYVKSIKDQRAGTDNIAYIVCDANVGSIKLKSSVSGALLNGAVLDGIVLPADIDGDGITSDFTGIYIDGYAGKVDVPGDVAAEMYFDSLGRLKVKGTSFTDIIVAGSSGQVSLGGDSMGDIHIGGSSSKLDLRGDQWGPISIGGSSRSLRIRGSLTGLRQNGLVSTIDIGGSASDVRVRGGVQVGSRLIVDGRLGRFDSGAISGQSVASEATMASNAVQVVATGSIGKVSVKGTVTGLRMLAGTDLGDDLMVGGVGADADFYTPASIGSFKVSTGRTMQTTVVTLPMGPITVTQVPIYGGGNVSGSLIGTAVTPVMGVLDLPSAQSGGAFLMGSIGKLDISGTLSGPGIGAYTFGSIKVGGVNRILKGFLIGPALDVYYTTL